MTDLPAEYGPLGDLASISGQDQRTAGIVNLAADIAAYHARLVKAGGMPKALIQELTLQAGHFLWNGETCTCDE